MKNVTYKSAGAGSGKTYYLTHILADILKEKKAAPEQVILTTFTKKAARDFKERSKKVLYENGLFKEAARLDNALIGTIHGVALQLIGKYWFFLGLSPKIETISDDDANLYMSQSLSTLPSDEEIGFLKKFVYEFDIKEVYGNGKGSKYDFDFWKEPLKKIIDFSTNHSIGSYDRSREESKKFFRQFVTHSHTPYMPWGKELEKLLKEVKAIPTLGNCTKRVKTFNDLWEARKYPNIFYFVKLGELIGKIPDVGSYPGIAAKGQEFSNLWQSKKVCDEICRYIDLMFDLAERWRKEYDKYKRDHNLLDFNDQEKYFLDLLENEECAEEISKEFRYVFVDEFQDCSPKQVKIFERLSELVEHSYWVGDNKQAIYGFRASDPELTETIVAIAETTPEDGNRVESLEKSYRSVPGIVNCCNEMFTRVFPGLPAERVELSPNRKSNPEVDSLIVWPETTLEVISQGVADLIEEGEKPSQIAILARTSDSFPDLVALLEKRGIPVNYESLAVKNSKVTKLVAAVLEVFDNSANNLAKATIGFLTENGFDTERIIEKTLSSINEEGKRNMSFLDEIPLVAKINRIRERHKHQSVGKVVETLLLEAGIYEEAKKLLPGKEGERVIDTIISEAAKYEEGAMRLGLVPSLPGFVAHLLNDEIMVGGNPEGVVISTIHSAKGLEWRRVIVMELNENPTEIKKFIKREVFGVHFHKVEEPSKGNLYPEVYITLLPYLYNVGNAKVPLFIESVIVGSGEFEKLVMNKVYEEGRLLYVAFTRPSETLILTEMGKRDSFKWHEIVNLRNGASVEDLKENYGFKEKRPILPTEEEEELTTAKDKEPEFTYKPKSDRELERLNYSPSSLPGILPDPNRGQEDEIIKSRNEFRNRIPFSALIDKTEADLGNCIHHIFEMFENEEPSEELMRNVIKQHDLDNVLQTTKEIKESWLNLIKTLEQRHGKIRNHRHERHFRYHKDGKVYNGSIDMTVETEQGTVLIDFKSCPMGAGVFTNEEKNQHYVGLYAGQLKCYADVLEANGEKPVASYIYYPVSGYLAELDMDKVAQLLNQ